jgi:hypothetical protein
MVSESTSRWQCWNSKNKWFRKGTSARMPAPKNQPIADLREEMFLEKVEQPSHTRRVSEAEEGEQTAQAALVERSCGICFHSHSITFAIVEPLNSPKKPLWAA